MMIYKLLRLLEQTTDNPQGSGTQSTPTTTPSAPDDLSADTDAGNSGSDSVDWDSLNTDFEASDDDSDDTPVATPPAVAKPAAPTEPPAAATPPAATTPPAAPAAAPASPPVAAAPAAAPGVVPPPSTPAVPPVQLDEAALEKQRQELLAKRETELLDYYALTEDDQTQMQTEPGVVLPKLAAKLHMSIQSQIASAISQALPSLVQGIMQSNDANAKAKAAFYDAWPGLEQHEQYVLQTGEFFRKANPNATGQEAIDRIGALVCASLGVDPATVRKQVAAAGGGPVPNLAPAGAPFRPAAPGGAVGKGPAPSNNFFEALAEEFLEDDQSE